MEGVGAERARGKLEAAGQKKAVWVEWLKVLPVLAEPRVKCICFKMASHSVSHLTSFRRSGTLSWWFFKTFAKCRRALINSSLDMTKNMSHISASLCTQ